MLFHIFKRTFLLALGCTVISLISSCNKEFEDIPQTVIPSPVTWAGIDLYTTFQRDTSFSFFKAAIDRAGMGTQLGDDTLRFTIFAPDNNAFRLSGIPSLAVVNALPLTTIVPLVQYHITPQLLPAEDIPTTFPNLPRPTLFNPAPSVSSLLRLNLYPSRRANGAWVNTVPLTQTNVQASNGIIHKVLFLAAPPSVYIDNILTSDTSLTFLNAALTRADSGRTTLANGSLREAYKSIGANLTLLAPVNDAFRAFLAAQGIPAPYSPAMMNAFPVLTLRGLLTYHTLPVRAYSVNMPTTATAVPTLLNSGVPTHPGVTLQATFTGPFANFTVKGLLNPSASNVVTKDINALNGVVHKIDQVLRPQ